MRLEKLIENLKIKQVLGNIDIEVLSVKTDSNTVTSGSLFICLNGKGFDGHSFIRQVESYGAVAVLTERRVETALTQIIVEDTRVAMSIIAAEFYEHADKKLRLVGVTGTNGKTTTAHLIRSVLNKAGIPCGVIGTLGTFYADKCLEPTLTTPDPLVLHKTFSDMLNSGIKAVVMEVSAHAVHFEKVKNLEYEVGVFTNFSRDHLDFFCDLENYKQAKLKFFKENRCKYMLTNSDDEVGREIGKLRNDVISYGIDNPSDVFAIEIKERADGVSFVLNLFDYIYDMKLNLIGKFNVYNAMAAASAAALIGVETDKIVKIINEIDGVVGRLECVYKGKFDVYVDYAHTPDGLENVLKALKPICRTRLICIFGCGGNRDKGKRKQMGEVSGRLADFTVITSDNPRYEEPISIISEIEEGVLQVTTSYVVVQDREEAIKYALNSAGEGDVLLIAGKGSEQYQEVLGIKRLYNDKDTVNNIIRGIN